jgi:hypothetical protein
MTWKFVNNSIGLPPIEGPAVAVPTNLRDLPTQPGMFVTAVDAVYGFGEFVFARASAGIRQFGLCTLLPVWNSTNRSYTYDAVEVANTANLAQTLGVSQIVLTTGQYGWFQVAGVGPVSAQASVAAGVSFGITAAGQVGAVAAGKQVLNARTVAASTLAVVSAGTGVISETVINVASTEGMFLGMALTGTGVGAGVITYIDPLGKYIVNSVANSAAVTGNVTATATGYIVASFNRPFAQGAIT